MRIKNINYRNFLDNGIIEFVTEDQIKLALNNIKGIRGKYIKEARALLLVLYFTGCRPVEALQIKAKDIKKEGSHLLINMRGSKRGLNRTIYLPFKNVLVKEIYDFAISNFEEIVLFYHFKNEYVRTKVNKKGVSKQHVESTDRLRYYFSKWFKGVVPNLISPYYLRHNRFSKLSMKGASLEELRLIKGSKTFASITPYIHLSSETAKKISKKID